MPQSPQWNENCPLWKSAQLWAIYWLNLYWLSLALINIGELCAVHNQVPKAKVDKMLLWPNLWGQSFSVTVLCRPAWMRISSCSSATAWGDQSLLWRHLSLQPTPNSCHHNRFESHNCVNINVTHKNSRDIDIPNIGNSTMLQQKFPTLWAL